MTSNIRRSVAFTFTALAVLLTAGVAGAQETDDPYIAPSPTVENATTIAPSPTAAADVAGETAEAGNDAVASASLAFTGGDIVGLALIGSVALALGAVMIRLRSRRAETVA